MHFQDGASAMRTITDTGNGHVQEVVRQAHDELRQLLHQRAEVMRRIGTIKQTIAGLANLFGDSVLSDELLELVDRKSSGRQPGFTKACRMILMDSKRALSARDVCDRIQEKASPLLARHKDPMASVTTVLNRLVAYGEAQAVSTTAAAPGSGSPTQSLNRIGCRPQPCRERSYPGGNNIPFSRCRVTCAYDAACGSCVTITIVLWKSSFSRFRISKTSVAE